MAKKPTAVRRALSAAITAIRAWDERGHKSEDRDGQEYVCLDQGVEDALQTLAKSTKGRQIATDDRALVLALDVFFVEFESWARSTDLPDVPLDGTTKLWDLWADVLEAAKPPRIRVLEPIQVNANLPGLTDKAFAKLYYLKNADGTPDTSTAIQARLNPEKFAYLTEGPHPLDKADADAIDAAWAERAAKIDEAEAEAQIDDERREPIELLIKQGLSLEQVRKIYHDLDDDQIRAKGEEVGMNVLTTSEIQIANDVKRMKITPQHSPVQLAPTGGPTNGDDTGGEPTQDEGGAAT